MKEILRCKVCGYIWTKGDSPKTCPACGITGEIFEPYKENISKIRRFILHQYIHPILVHFPVAFVITIFAASILAFLVPGSIQVNLISTIKVLSFCLPFVTLIAFIAGALDAKLRFKKYNTPLITQKLILGSLFLLLAIMIFLMNHVLAFSMNWKFIWTIILSALSIITNIFLGLIGSSLMNSVVPGK